MSALRDLLARDATASGICRMSDEEVLERIAWRRATGGTSISVLPAHAPPGSSTAGAAGGGAAAPAEPTGARETKSTVVAGGATGASAGVAATTTSWIEIELLGEDGKPIGGERYEITLPDGRTVVEGRLDGAGLGRAAGFEKGTCLVRFPDLDREAWSRA